MSEGLFRGRVVGITGCCGFIGLKLIERIREISGSSVELKGLDAVNPFADSLSPLLVRTRRRLEKCNVKFFHGTVNDEDTVKKLCASCDVIIHLAAIVRDDGDLSFFLKVNVEGTRLLARTAREAGVGKFFQFSSVMVYGFNFPPNVDEDGPQRGENNPYCITKIESEKVVLQYNGKQSDGKNMEVIIVRPGDVYGPESVPWVVKPLRAAKKMGTMLVPYNGYINHVHVDNLIDGVFILLEKGIGGEAYNVAEGAATPFYDYFADLFKRCLGKPQVMAVPKPIAKIIFYLIFFFLLFMNYLKIGKEFSQEIDFSVTALEFLSRPKTYSIEKMKRLGYSPKVTLNEGMDQIEKWFKEEKPF